MTDPRVTNLARVLTHYSLAIQAGEQMLINTGPLAQELTIAVYKEAVLAGAHVLIMQRVPGTREFFFKNANDEQLQYLSPVHKLIYETFDAELSILAPDNLRELEDVAPDRLRVARKPIAELTRIANERGEARRLCITAFPTEASAQAANMRLEEYQDFVYEACLLDLPDPIRAWEDIAVSQDRLVNWLAGKSEVIFSGPNIDLNLSIKGRTFLADSGKGNFPGGEIFTSPVETSIQGWVRFSYPGFFAGKEIDGIELWLADGKVIRAEAAHGQEVLNSLLDTDPGARYFGEWGIGTNYGIQRISKNMLFDEKIGGTIHFAIGQGFFEAGGLNQSGLHSDMLCDMTNGEIVVDGELFYKNGKIAI